MDRFSFKNYPPKVLVFLICLIIAIKFGLHKVGALFFKQAALLSWTDLSFIALSAGTVMTLMTWINRKVMWKWLLNLLGLCDVRGVYEGYIVSSFHHQDNPEQSNIKRYSRIRIFQNINGLYISGEYFPDEQMNNPSSSFTSYNEEIKKQADGNFQLYYFFKNEGDQLHIDHDLYGLNNHTGICVLTYRKEEQTLEGYYFNRERSSHGKVFLKRVP
jgi:hypothetical protein